jgi:ribosomal protein L11 methyltransferase
MPDHIQITFTDIEPEQQEWVIAHLAEAGYEGFEEGEHELKAFILKNDYDRILLKDLAFKYQLVYSEQTIPSQNWNAVWESNFPPVVVDDLVAVRAHFHEPLPGVKHEIVITPKMSFGTGHHATTWLMMQQMGQIDFRDKTVLDFGTGTGVLAILAEKLGAKEIIALDNDNWSLENATENIQRNHCRNIHVKQAENARSEERFDIILANINKHVILDNISIIAGQLKTGGTVLLSGLLKTDQPEILAVSSRHMLVSAGAWEKDNWLCLKFTH